VTHRHLPLKIAMTMWVIRSSRVTCLLRLNHTSHWFGLENKLKANNIVILNHLLSWITSVYESRLVMLKFREFSIAESALLNNRIVTILLPRKWFCQQMTTELVISRNWAHNYGWQYTFISLRSFLYWCNMETELNLQNQPITHNIIQHMAHGL